MTACLQSHQTPRSAVPRRLAGGHTVNKKDLSERDICTIFITPALTAAGWDINSQVREQVYLTDGQVIVRGRMVRRGERKFADYVLFYKPNIPIAGFQYTSGRGPKGTNRPTQA